MNYDVCIFGELQFPVGGLAAWQKLAVDARVFSDWPEAFQMANEAEELVSVGSWIDDCTRYERPGELFFLEILIDTEKNIAKVRGLVEEEEYDRYKSDLATMVRLGASTGASGSLTFVSKPTEPFALGYRIEVEPNFTRMRKLSKADANALPDRGAIEDILRRVPVARFPSEARGV